MDVKTPSILSRGINDKPTLLPSGTVIASGKGMFIPGVGHVDSQVKAGDHVAIVLAGPLQRMPISDDPNEIFVVISEAQLIGRLGNADVGSPWWKTENEPDKMVLQ